MYSKEQFSKCNVQGYYHIECGHEGDRSKNKFKYKDDGKIFEKEIQRIDKENEIEKTQSSEEIERKKKSMSEDEKDKYDFKNFLYIRYLYYCAQSYRDYGVLSDSIYIKKGMDYYKRVITFENGSKEEKYFSCLQLWAFEQKVDYLLESFKYNNERLECVIEYMKYLIERKNYNIVKDLFYKYKDYKKIDFSNCLLIMKEYYNYNLEYLYTLSADKVDDYEMGLKCCVMCIENNINIETCIRNAEVYKLLMDFLHLC